MATRKAETEKLVGGASEARAKSAMVKLDTQPKLASSEPSYESITQQIACLMSAITNKNADTNGQKGPRHNNGGGKLTITKSQRPKKIERICFVRDAEVLDMDGRSAQHPEKVIISLSDWPTEI